MLSENDFHHRDNFTVDIRVICITVFISEYDMPDDFVAIAQKKKQKKKQRKY